jgi:cob(I)alamin adenosyltransferase
MGNRLSKITTRTGDDGSTGLADGSRVRKDDARIEAIGDVDELNSCVGILLSCELPEQLAKLLIRIQHDLFDLGGELSIPTSSIITEKHCKRLDDAIEKSNADLEPLKEFILPGGHQAAAFCHLARAICRRAERHTIAIKDNINPTSIVYLNRLSDLLFIAARLINKHHHVADVMWQSARFTQGE